MRRRLAALLALLLATAGGAAAAAELPGGLVLLRDALADDGRTVATLAPAGERCWAVRLLAQRAGRWTTLAEQAGPRRPAAAEPCPPLVGTLSGNGRTVALASPWEGAVTVLDLDGGRLLETGRIELPGQKGKDFPAPGPLLALQRDGGGLLVGAPHHDCVLAVPEDACGVAHLFVRQGSGWVEQVRFPRPDGASPTDRFAQAVALSGDGRVALVGGPGSYGRAGRLWVYERAADGGWDLLGDLASPDPADLEFGQDLALSDDGAVVAVAGDQKVVLFRRQGDAWPAVATVTSEDPLIGTFGGAVALSGAATLLVVGAPRSACPTDQVGSRCGAVRLFELRLRGQGIAVGEPQALEPVAWLPMADFGWRVATDAGGRLVAVQGRIAQLYPR
jgi:hypothetical protein